MKKIILWIFITVISIQAYNIKSSYSDAKRVAEYVNKFKGTDYPTRYNAWFFSRMSMQHLATKGLIYKVIWVKTFNYYDVVVNKLIKERK